MKRHEKNKDPNELTLGEHLRELKRRVFSILLAFVVVFILAYVKSENILTFVMSLGKKAGYTFVYISPQEVILQQLRIAGVFSIIVVLPLIIYHIARFVSPIFTSKHAFRKLILVGIGAILFFVAGTLFAYKVLLPFVYQFFYGLGKDLGVQANVSLSEYLSLFLTIEICLGVVTEMPLACLVLTRAGVINSNILRKGRSVATVIIFIVGAIITPPDAISQCMVAIPMVGLYQLSIWVSILAEKKKRGKQK